MLGRLKMSVADCIATNLSLSHRVFRKTRHRVKVKGQVQGRFDAEKLVQAIKDVASKAYKRTRCSRIRLKQGAKCRGDVYYQPHLD
jgi:hypothetical protein